MTPNHLTRDDRGQLILIGAVTFALILIGIAVVFSTTLFTANLSGNSGTADLSGATAAESDVDRTTAELIERVNEEHDEEEALKDAITESMDAYDRAISDRQASSGPVIVSVAIEDEDDDIVIVDDNGDDKIDSVDVEVVYETRSVTTERTIEVTDND